MANFLETLNAVMTGLGGLAQITNQQAKERQDRELEGAKLLAQLKDYEFVPASNIQRSPFLDAMAGGQGIAQGQRVVNVAGQPFIVRPRQTLGERMPGLFAPVPQVPKPPLALTTEATPAPPSINLVQAEPMAQPTGSVEPQQPTNFKTAQALGQPFMVKAQQVAKRLGMSFNDLLSIMNFETGGTFSTAAKNKKSGATGLIQFMPRTAEDIGTTTAALAKMTPEQQLDYVEQYFTPYAGKLKNLQDAYMAVLYPKAIGKSPATILFRQGTPEYLQNAGLDTGGKGYVTIADAVGKVRDYASRTGVDSQQESPAIALRPSSREQALVASAGVTPSASAPQGDTVSQTTAQPQKPAGPSLPSGTTLPPLPPKPKPLEEMPGIDRAELQQYVMSDPFIQSLKNDRSQDAQTKLQARVAQLTTEFRAEKRLDWQQKMDLRKEEWANYRAGITQRASALSEGRQADVQHQMLALEKHRQATEDRLLAEANRRDEKDFYARQAAILKDIGTIKDDDIRRTLNARARALRPGELDKLAELHADVQNITPTHRWDTVGMRHEYERVQNIKKRGVELLRLSPLDAATQAERERLILAENDYTALLSLIRNIPAPAKPGAISQSTIIAMETDPDPAIRQRGAELRRQWMEFTKSVTLARASVPIELRATLSARQKELMDDASHAIAASRDENGRIDESVASKHEALLYQSGLKKEVVNAVLNGADVLQQRKQDELSRKTAAAADLHRKKAQTTQEILEVSRQAQGQQGVDLVQDWFAKVDASRRIDGTPDPVVVTQALAALGAAKMPSRVLTMFADGVGATAAEVANRELAKLPARIEQAEQISGIRLDEATRRFALQEGFKLQRKLLADAQRQPSSDGDRDALTAKILAVDVQKDPTAPAQLLALSTQVQGPIGTQNRMAFASALAVVELKRQRGEPLNDRDKQVLLTEKVYRDRLDTNLTSTEILARAMDGLMAQRRGDPLTEEQQKAIELYRRYTLELNPTPGRVIAAQVSDDPEMAMKAEIMRHVELKQLGEDAAEKATQTFLHGPVAEATKDKLVRLTELKRSLTQLASFPKDQRDAFVGMFDMPLEKAKSAAGQAAETLGFRGEKGKEEASAAFERFHVALNQVKLLSAFREGGKQLTESEALITFGFVPTGDETPTEFATKLIFNISGVDYVLKMNLALSTSMRRDLNGYSSFIDKTMYENADQWGMRKIIPGFPQRPATEPPQQPSYQQMQPRLPVRPIPRVAPTPTPQATPLQVAPQQAPTAQRPVVAPRPPVNDPDEDFALPPAPRR